MGAEGDRAANSTRSPENGSADTQTGSGWCGNNTTTESSVSGEALPACLPPTLGGNRPFPAFLKLREGNSNATRVQLRTFDPFSGAATCPLLRVTTRGNDGWSDGTFAHLNAPASELPDSAPRRSGQPRRDLERLLLGDERPARPSLAL